MFGENELFKEVQKISLSEILPKHKFPPGFDYAVIDENDNILNFCSNKYSLVENSKIFRPIEKQFEELDIEFIRSIKIINKAKFYVDYIIKDRKDAEGIVGILPKISVWNSYDGGSMLRHETGFFRLVCSNGLTRPIGISKKDIYRHATGADSVSVEEKICEIIQDSKDFITNASSDIEIFQKLAEQKVTKRKIKSVGNAVGLSKKIIECAEDRFDLEVGENLNYKNEFGENVQHNKSERNMFVLYNALNFGIYNTNLKELPERKIEKDRKLLSLIIE